MRIIIRAKGIELADQLRNFIEEKIGSLKKYIDVPIYVDIEKETKHHKKGNVFKTEAKILLPGKKIIAKAEGNDLPLSVVKLKDKLQQEIKKYKLKNTEARRRFQRKNQEEIL